MLLGQHDGAESLLGGTRGTSSRFNFHPVRAAAGMLGVVATTFGGMKLFKSSSASPSTANVLKMSSESVGGTPFLPKEGINRVLPGPANALQLLSPPSGQESPACLFLHGETPTPELAKGAKTVPAWVYGAKAGGPGGSLAVASGNPSDVLKGLLVCWPEMDFHAKLKEADQVHKKATAEVKRGTVRVVTEDGKATEAHWYFQPVALTRPSGPEKVHLGAMTLLNDPYYNKGEAFTEAERVHFGLVALLPRAVRTQDQQAAQKWEDLQALPNDLERYKYMAELSRQNVRLYYRMLRQYTKKLLPVVYTPTVGEACVKYGSVYAQPGGLYISAKDKGHVLQRLHEWPRKTVKVIVFTDGERILGLGDQGAHGMPIPIGKLALYTALAGVPPEQCLPVTLDVGTNNQNHLKDPKYLGLRQERLRGQAYDDLIEEFMTSVVQYFGPSTLLQFEDFGNLNAFRLLKKYENRVNCFNDDIQGTSAVTLSGVLGAMRLAKKKLADQKVMLFGAGSAGIGIANLIAYAMSVETGKTVDEHRKQIYLVDSNGLLTKNRPSGGSSAEKEPFETDHHPHMHQDSGVAAMVKAVKPAILIGVSAVKGYFDEEVIRAMATHTDRPVIFALSNPHTKAECTAEEAIKYTDGKVLFASGTAFPEYTYKGQLFIPGQGNNAYIFPGVGLATVAVQALRVPNSVFYTSALAVAKQLGEKELSTMTVYPAIERIADVTLDLAVDIAEEYYRLGLATLQPKPKNMRKFLQDYQYKTEYPIYHN
eukprot:g8928.t1